MWRERNDINVKRSEEKLKSSIHAAWEEQS
jgi:hypothetical protein